MKLFDDDGHLNDTSFLLLQNGDGDDLQRLEISEHLSYCDDCLCRYLENISNIELLTPVPSMTASIKEKGKRIKASLFYRRFTVAVAAFMAMVLWTTGVFSWQYGLIERNLPARGLIEKNQRDKFESYIIQQGSNRLSIKISEKFSEIINQVENLIDDEKIYKNEENKNGEE